MFYNDDNVKKIKEEGVWLYKNFISDDECAEILNEVNKFTDKDWLDGWARHQGTLFYTNSPESEKAIEEWWNDKVSPPVLIPIVTKINKKLKDLFSPELIFLPEYKIVRLVPGQNMKAHKDNRAYTDGSEVKQQFTISCAYTLYLSNFTGGEINYPEIGYTHTPRPGDLIIHSGHVQHEVFDVLDGIRYTITGWLLNK
jgi:hypothetical protein